MVKIVKMNGETDEFCREKLLRSCERAGASRELCTRIVDHVEKKAYDGMRTKEILSIMHSMLKSEDRPSAMRYNLKEAISRMDPEIHEFEFFISRLLKYDGYDTRHSPEPKVQGRCVDHEIDVIAKKGAELAIVECKHHYRGHTFTGLDTPMRQWARLDDVIAGYKAGHKNAVNATSAWVITNTKYSDHAVKYSKCKGVRLSGWHYPVGNGLSGLIEKYRSYPLLLVGLSHEERKRLYSSNIFDVLDFLHADDQFLADRGFKAARVRRIKSMIEMLINSKIK